MNDNEAEDHDAEWAPRPRWYDLAARQLGFGMSPFDLSRFEEGIDDATSLGVDEWPDFGRTALRAAARAGARALREHVLRLRASDAHFQKMQALERILQGIADYQRLLNLDLEFMEAAAALSQICEARMSINPPSRSGAGSPGAPHLKAMANAAAEVWSAHTKRVIPRSGKMDERHELKRLLATVSTDLQSARVGSRFLLGPGHLMTPR